MVLGTRKKEIAALKVRISELEKDIDCLNQIIKNSSSRENPLFNFSSFQKLFDSGGFGLWTFSSEDDRLWLSGTAKNILGYKNDIAPSLDLLRNSILPEDKPVFEKALADVKQGLKIAEFEIKIARTEADGREFRAIMMNITSITNEKSSEKKVFECAGYIKDITRQDKIRRDLIRSRERAEESERLKNALLANISHEIRTPMNSIIGFSELLNIGNLPFDKRLEYVRTIKNQGLLLLKMIDDVVELTRIETGKVIIRKSPCNINLMMNEMLTFFNQFKVSQNKEHLEIRIKYPENRNLIIYTDPGRLQQIISSLLNNSIKYTEKGGIEIGYKLISEQRIEFFVKDSGIGLSRDLQKRLFGKPPEEDNAGRSDGSGLGLTIAKNVIKLMGGKIWVESELGQGSTFFFTIPYEEVPASYHEIGPEEEYVIPSYNWKDKVIVIAEDDEINFKFLEAVLHDTSAQILHARNGSEAVELCRSINKIDLVLMDLKMPVMDGFEATRQIRQFNRKIPIILQTAFLRDDELPKCEEIGCNDYITKPIEIKKFFEKVDEYLKIK